MNKKIQPPIKPNPFEMYFEKFDDEQYDMIRSKIIE